MIEQPAIVSSIQPQRIMVRPGPGSLCEGCKSRGKCNANIFASLFTKRQTELPLQVNTDQSALKVNDEIMVGIQERDFLRLAFILYGLPIICLVMVAAGLSYLLPLFGSHSEIPVILVSLLSIPFCYRYLSTRHASRLSVAPQFLYRIGEKKPRQIANP